MPIKQALILIVLLISISCSTQNEGPKVSTEYILFGHFYGECLGEQCIEIFKLTDEALFEDNTDTYPNSTLPFKGNFRKLDDEKYQQVKSLDESIPNKLLNEQDTIIGMPDYADGGGVYFAINNGGTTRFWLIDQTDQNIPEYLRPFKKSINDAIALINQ